MKTLLLILLLPLNCFAAIPTSWLTGHIIDEKGVDKTGSITIAPQFQSMLIGTQYVSGSRFSLTLTNGGFTNQLVNGDYLVIIGGLNSPIVSVPGDGSTNNFIDLINTNGLLYSWKSPGAVVKLDGSDSTFGFLGDKLTFTSPLATTTNNYGSNESITLAIPRGTNGASGYLYSGDWDAFTAKQAGSTNLTAVASGGGIAANWNASGTTNQTSPGIASMYSGTFTNGLTQLSYSTIKSAGTLSGYMGHGSGLFGAGGANDLGMRAVDQLLFSANDSSTPMLALNTDASFVGTGPFTSTKYVISGTTNQVVFGSTNTAPSGTSTPTKWISVQVTGESTVYRIPLYE